jgi:N-acetylneuraminate synthase
MANVAEIHAAVVTARAVGNNQLIVLGCTASYPATPTDSNIRGIPLIADTFDVVPGLSDHTLGIGVPVAAVALGACVIEKHVTLARGDGGVDSDFSLEPAELGALVAETERAWQALGAPRIGPKDSEREVLRLRRSLYVVADVVEGDVVTAENVRSIRPAGGLPPAELSTVLGRRFRAGAVRGTPLTWDLV